MTILKHLKMLFFFNMT